MLHPHKSAARAAEKGEISLSGRLFMLALHAAFFPFFLIELWWLELELSLEHSLVRVAQELSR
jgi:hypothetical protein